MYSLISILAIFWTSDVSSWSVNFYNKTLHKHKKSQKIWETYNLSGQFHRHRCERFLPSDWLGIGPAASLFGPQQLGKGETGKSGNPTLHYRCKLWGRFGRFSWLCPGRTVTRQHPLSVATLFHSPSDDGQITTNCLFHYYVLLLLVKSDVNDIIA